MKKLLVCSLFMILCLAPWACTKEYPLAPAPVFTPTPTSTFTALPTKTLTPTSTPIVTATSTPVCGFTNLGPVGFTWSEGPMVITTLAEWQSNIEAYAGTTPPVDFTTQMVIVTVLTEPCPTSGLSITNVCEGPNQITISANNVAICNICNYETTTPQRSEASAVAVPLSNLPVVWNITNVSCGQETPVPSFVPVLATPIP